MYNYEELKKQVKFKQGWTLTTDFTLFDKSQCIPLIFDTASEDDPISKTQYKTYQWLHEHATDFFKECLPIIETYLKSIRYDIIPYLLNNQSLDKLETLIKFDQVMIKDDGQLVLLFDETWDENGVVVVRLPDGKIKVGPAVMIWD